MSATTHNLSREQRRLTEQLLPHLHRATNGSTLPDLWTKQFEKANAMRLSSGSLCFADFLELGKDDSILSITLPVEQSQDVQALLPTLLTSQPSRRFREEDQRNSQNRSRNCLHSPRDAESGRSIDGGSTAVADGSKVTLLVSVCDRKRILES